MAKKRLPADVLAFFRRQGAKGGKIGGRRAAARMTIAERKARARKGGLRAAERMTAAQRTARAKKAGLASAAVRRAKAKADPQ